MSIVEGLLYSAGATEEHFHAGDYIFREEAMPQYYYQIVTGEVKLNSYNEDGKEFIQNIFSGTSSFGESLLLLGKPYPINAVAISKCTVIKVAKDQFFRLLRDHPQVFIDLCRSLSELAYSKFMLMRKISSKNADERLIELMNLLKNSPENRNKLSFEIPYTRQQLASLTGLRIETAIRAIKRLERNDVLVIKNGKIYY